MFETYEFKPLKEGRYLTFTDDSRVHLPKGTKSIGYLKGDGHFLLYLRVHRPGEKEPDVCTGEIELKMEFLGELEKQVERLQAAN